MGPHTQLMVESILRDRPHPELGYRSCVGILRLEKTYGAERLEAARERVLLVNARSYQLVKAILKNGMDRQKQDDCGDGAMTFKFHVNPPSCPTVQPQLNALFTLFNALPPTRPFIKEAIEIGEAIRSSDIG